MVIWVITGLITGVALSIFVNGGPIWLVVGLVVGLLLAFFLTRPEQEIEED
jgi:F0F1-type ATP synthase assembly protein I